jgi:hypothetical protein
MLSQMGRQRPQCVWPALRIEGAGEVQTMRSPNIVSIFVAPFGRMIIVVSMNLLERGVQPCHI